VARLPSVRTVLDALRVHHDHVGDDLAVGASTFEQLIRSGLFTGLDEVWLCTRVPRLPKPATIRITADVPLVAGGVSAELVDWMDANGCLVGLGDGDGVNYVTLRPDLLGG